MKRLKEGSGKGKDDKQKEGEKGAKDKQFQQISVEDEEKQKLLGDPGKNEEAKGNVVEEETNLEKVSDKSNEVETPRNDIYDNLHLQQRWEEGK